MSEDLIWEMPEKPKGSGLETASKEGACSASFSVEDFKWRQSRHKGSSDRLCTGSRRNLPPSSPLQKPGGLLRGCVAVALCPEMRYLVLKFCPQPCNTALRPAVEAWHQSQDS